MKAFFTKFTHVWRFPSVNTNINLQVACPAKYYTEMVFLRYELSYGSSVLINNQNIFRKYHTCIASLQRELPYASPSHVL